MQKEETGQKDLRDRTKRFALQMIRMFTPLPKTTEAQVLGKQVIRSATSVGANYREAYRGRSRDYAYALATLDRYDHGTLSIEETTRKALRVIDYDEAIGIVNTMKGGFYGLFGIQKDPIPRNALNDSKAPAILRPLYDPPPTSSGVASFHLAAQA